MWSGVMTKQPPTSMPAMTKSSADVLLLEDVSGAKSMLRVCGVFGGAGNVLHAAPNEQVPNRESYKTQEASYIAV